MIKFLRKNILYIAWAQALIATLGSLYFSEIRHFTPCVLCWYQRILMYPLVLIIAVGILKKDKQVYQYVFPLSLIGFGIAFYHVLLQNGILPESIAPCVLGASCIQKHVGYFGFITIPLLSLTAFAVINICMYVYKKYDKRD
jgi:disulfide bond formation protein DsbB